MINQCQHHPALQMCTCVHKAELEELKKCHALEMDTLRSVLKSVSALAEQRWKKIVELKQGGKP